MALSGPSERPGGLKYDPGVLALYPGPHGMQHDELKVGLGLVTKIFRVSWAKTNRKLPPAEGGGLSTATMHRSVYERFDGPPVQQYDRMALYRPETLRSRLMPSGHAHPQTARIAGYTIGSETCGQAPFVFPRLRIGLRPGYCAGLVASAEDGLQFPRSIIQIPGHDLFVVADMVGWTRSKGRLLLLDSSLPSGHRTKVLLDRVDYPFGLGIGIDKKIYSSTTETIFRFDPLWLQSEALGQADRQVCDTSFWRILHRVRGAKRVRTRSSRCSMSFLRCSGPIPETRLGYSPSMLDSSASLIRRPSSMSSTRLRPTSAFPCRRSFASRSKKMRKTAAHDTWIGAAAAGNLTVHAFL
jgi:hypothetical protein